MNQSRNVATQLALLCAVTPYFRRGE